MSIGLLVFLAALVPSCSDRALSEDQETVETEDIPIFTQQKNVPDSLIKVEGEDYPVINEMLRSYKPHHVKLAGTLLASNQVWMKSDSINQTLAFVIGSDYQRKKIFHFFSDNIPDLLQNHFDFELENGDKANKEKSESILHSYLKSSARVDLKYFKSNLDFELGDIIGKAIRTHGKPDKVQVSGSIEELTWTYIGELAWTKESNLKNRPLIKNSWGQIIRMYFDNRSLIAVMIENLTGEKDS